MVQFTVDIKKLTNFVKAFGSLNDIVFRVKDNEIEAAVGQDTHYLRKRLSVENTENGNLPIANLTKLLAFLKATKTGNVTLNHRSKSSTVHVTSERTSLTLPTSTYLKSQSQLPLIEKLVNAGEESMWQKWAGFDLTSHGIIMGDDLQSATYFDKVVGGKFSCKLEFDAHEMTIMAGSKVKGKMFVRAPVTDGKVKGEASYSSFAHWLPTLLETVPPGALSIHTGEETVLVIEQPDTGYLLVVMDQEFEED